MASAPSVRGAADTTALISSRVLAFFALLREEHGFSTSHAEARDALRALEVLGVSNALRVRAALRAIACSTREQVAVFEETYERFFLDGDRGAPQQRHADDAASAATVHDGDEPAATEKSSSVNRHDAPFENAPAGWMKLGARISATPAVGPAPRLEPEGLDGMLRAARTLVRSIRLGRARRWIPQAHGPRFDMRRTLRASLQTGGDPITLRRLGPPRRAPRIVVLVDGSRSMATSAVVHLQLAYALSRATRRARTYVFSTSLIDLTRFLAAARPGDDIEHLGEAWGGGTRLGANLTRFVHDDAPRVLDAQTVVIVASDGLDSGNVAVLQHAMREIRRRSARIVWLNPHMRSSGFAPTAGGMHCALPFIDVLEAVADASDVDRLATALARGRPP